MQSYQTTSYAMPSNKAEVLDQINSEREVVRMINNFLGISYAETIENNMRRTKAVRVCRPSFTYEFTHQLKGLLDGFLNFAIQVSRWEKESINTHCNRVGMHLTLFLATTGDDNYISEQSWKRITAIQASPGNWSQFGITWEYDRPVTYPMLALVREENEEVDQGVFFNLIVKEFLTLMESSLNKGYAQGMDPMGQLPKMLTEIKTENSVIRETGAQPMQSMTGGQQKWT
jgi:hypothetical protein